MPTRGTPQKKDDHFSGELDDTKKKHVRKAIGHILDDYRDDYEKGIKVLVTPKTLLPYLKVESDIYDYLTKKDMDSNKPGFMKIMSNYIQTTMKNKDMVSVLMDANGDRQGLREVSEDIQSVSEGPS